MQVAIIGAGSCTGEEWRTAYEVGREVARNGATLICGGLGGVMEAACQGAREEEGLTVGVLPGVDGENPYVQVVIRSCLSHARNFVLVQSADVVIAVGGSYGTLSEIAIACRIGRPVFGLHTWDIPGVISCKSPKVAVVRAIAAASRR
ncbi:MAG: TIGR00725 family protein [Methanomicrobiales archaeon]|nr:TIGR00725 family protein [Methanomicrobiales archaeon]